MMDSEADTPREVGPRELLAIRERPWSFRLSNVSLAAEYPVDDDHRQQTLECLGRLYRSTYGHDARARLLRQWPAVQVISTTGVASDHYASGAFWPKLTKMLGVTNDQAFHAEWGQAFLSNLRELGLPVFDNAEDAGSTYVGRILMHTGIPTYCLRDYYRLVNERRSRVDGISPSEVVSWAAGRAQKKQLRDVDMPVARFLQYGGEFAVDVTDRSFDLLDALAAGGRGDDVPLPDRFKNVAREMHDSGGIVLTRPQSRRTASTNEHQPRLMIDPFGQGLYLRLPTVGDTPDGHAAWLVSLDDTTQRIGTKPLVPGSGELPPPTDVVITGPVRTASVALARREDLKIALSVIDENYPILAFGEDSVSIPAGLPLPDGTVWVLLPGAAEDLRFEGPAQIVAQSPMPPGWAGWSLIQIDLANTTSMTFKEVTRPVRAQAAARLVVGEPLRGVRTVNGSAVVTQVPTIRLPEELADATWAVAVLDADGEVVAQWRTGDGGTADSVWDSVPRPLVGTFTIRVRGPWGRGFTRSVTVAEGLDVTFSPAWRRFALVGLQPCVGTARAAAGVDLARTSIDFDSFDREQYLRVGSNGEFKTLVLTPPHMSIAYQSAGAAIASSIKPLSLYREEVSADPGTLVLDVGAAAEPKLHVLTPAGVVQVVEPGKGQAGVYPFNLARIVDTLAKHAQVTLSLDPDGAIAVATVRPQSLFSDVTYDETGLVFDNCVDLAGLTAYVYQCRAPWAPAVALPIVGGRAELPSSLLGAGPLVVMARDEDPWAPLPVPEWPPMGRARMIDLEGYPTGVDGEATAVSAFLAGVGPLPESVSDFSRLWSVRGRIGGLQLGERARLVAEAIDAAIFANPYPALVGLASSGASADRASKLAIETGLVWADLAAAHQDTAPTWSLQNALPATLLSAADGEWSHDEVDAAVEVCGDDLRLILAGHDPSANVGHFGANEEAVDASPPLRHTVMQAMGLVPTGLLSKDYRVLAMFKLIEERRDPRIEWLMKNGHKVLSDIDALLRRIDDPIALAAVGARRHRTETKGWQIVPTISLGLAFAARYAARGNEVAGGWLPRQRRHWADLAAVVPQLVTTDLILAELLVASASFQDQEETE